MDGDLLRQYSALGFVNIKSYLGLIVEKEDLKVSIIINVYNAQEYIKQFLNSLTKLTYKNYELLVVDDGSIDETLDIAKQFQSEFDMKFFRMDHRGLCAARAFGFQQAQGDICIFFDVDEEIKDIQIIEKFVQPYTEELVGGVGGNKYPIGNGWLYEANKLDRKLRQFLRANKDKKYARFLMGGVFSVRRKLVVELGGLSESDTIVEDTDISIRIRQAGRKLIISDDINVGHPDPMTAIGAFKRAVKQGEKILNLLIKYPKEIIDINIFLAYFPLWILITSLYNWVLTILLIFISFVFTQAIFIIIPFSSMRNRVNLWFLLWINGVGISLGSIIGVLNIIKRNFNKNN